MKRRIVRAGLMVAVVLMAAGHAQALTLTFDDITSELVATIPNGYGGLDWSSMKVVDGSSAFNLSGYENGAVSGNYTAFNDFAQVATVSGATFDFNSAYLTAAWHTGLSVTVTGFLGATQLYTQTVTVDTTGPTLFNFNYLGIDSLTFASSGGTSAGLDMFGTQFAMDDFTINAAPVPDSGSPLALLVLGVLVVAAFSARQH